MITIFFFLSQSNSQWSLYKEFMSEIVFVNYIIILVEKKYYNLYYVYNSDTVLATKSVKFYTS